MPIGGLAWYRPAHGPASPSPSWRRRQLTLRGQHSLRGAPAGKEQRVEAGDCRQWSGHAAVEGQGPVAGYRACCRQGACVCCSYLHAHLDGVKRVPCAWGERGSRKQRLAGRCSSPTQAACVPQLMRPAATAPLCVSSRPAPHRQAAAQRLQQCRSPGQQPRFLSWRH
jgi:hypothetical protein